MNTSESAYGILFGDGKKFQNSSIEGIIVGTYSGCKKTPFILL